MRSNATWSKWWAWYVRNIRSAVDASIPTMANPYARWRLCAATAATMASDQRM